MKRLTLLLGISVALSGLNAIAGIPAASIPERKKQKNITEQDAENLRAAREKRERRNQKRLKAKGGAA